MESRKHPTKCTEDKEKKERKKTFLWMCLLVLGLCMVRLFLNNRWSLLENNFAQWMWQIAYKSSEAYTQM